MGKLKDAAYATLAKVRQFFLCSRSSCSDATIVLQRLVSFVNFCSIQAEGVLHWLSQDAVHQAGIFSAGQVWGLTVLDEGTGSALRSEDWWPSWHWGDLGPLWKLDPAALLNYQNTNPRMKAHQHPTFCSMRGAIGFVLKSIVLLNCQLFSHCLVSLIFNLVISFFSVLSTYNIVSV